MSEYVTVPREPTDEMIRAGVAARWFVDNDEGKPANVRNSWEAMIAAAPPAASVRAMELAWIEDRFGDEFATPAADQRYTVQALADGEWLALRNGERLNGDVIYGTRAAGKAACQQHFNAYVRSLLAPTVDERAASSEPEMCPNCVTPWKCNGPHEFPAASSEAAKVDGIHTPATCRHPHCNCEHGCVADPAPTTADAGVTEAAIARLSEARYQALLWAVLQCNEIGTCHGEPFNRNYAVQDNILCMAARKLGIMDWRDMRNDLDASALPAPTTADAGVTEAMVETFEAKFLECARTRPDSTLRDDIRAALVAALGARKGSDGRRNRHRHRAGGWG